MDTMLTMPDYLSAAGCTPLQGNQTNKVKVMLPGRKQVKFKAEGMFWEISAAT